MNNKNEFQGLSELMKLSNSPWNNDMEKNEEQEKIYFRKTQPETDHSDGFKYFPVLPNTELKNNFFASELELCYFYSSLNMYGINPIIYSQEDYLTLPINSRYETRIISTPSIKDMLSGENLPNPINDGLMKDALYGELNIFSRQINPDKPFGINFAKKIKETGLPFMSGYVQARKEETPDADTNKLENLSLYIENGEFQPGKKISDYQIRLSYDTIPGQFQDLVSAFIFFNKKMPNPIEVIIEE